MKTNITNFYEFKRLYETKHNDYMFSSDTLKFFGESLSKMRLLKTKAIIKDYRGNEHTCYIISTTRTKNAFGSCKPYTSYLYFDDKTLERIID